LATSRRRVVAEVVPGHVHVEQNRARLGEDLGFTLEASKPVHVGREVIRQNLDRNIAIEMPVAVFETVPVGATPLSCRLGLRAGGANIPA